MATPSDKKPGRNDFCSCGSGKKFKHCCHKTEPAVQETPWSLQRRASDRLTEDMQRFANRRFHDEVQEAWNYFNQSPFPPRYDPKQADAQIFMPYFLFEWDPEPPRRWSGPRPGLVASAYLQKAVNELTEPEAMIFHQAVTQPVTFYDVIQSEPGDGLTLRDILLGGETTVVERSASRMLRPGDVVYAQIWRLPEVNTLGRLAPTPLPPRSKAEIVALRARLRKKVARRKKELGAPDLVRWGSEIRAVYLDILSVMRTPPRLVNTDGDSILFHTLTFRVGSAQAAFDALAPLASVHSREEILETAEIDPDGALRSVEIEWTKLGNAQHEHWDNTILGKLNISDRSLVATVNSKERAERLRQEVDRRLGILAVHLGTVTQTPEQIRKDRKLAKPALEVECEERDSALDPELKNYMEEELRKETEAWIHRKIPALGGRTPIQAIADPDGREIVEALLLDWERGNQRSAPAHGVLPDVDGVRRLLHLATPAGGSAPPL